MNQTLILISPIALLILAFFVVIQSKKIFSNWHNLKELNNGLMIAVLKGQDLNHSDERDTDMPYTDLTEKRHAPRKNIERIVDFVLDDRLFKKITDNISDTGVFLKSKATAPFKVNDKLTLAFQMPDTSPVKHRARIVRISKDGIGIQYLGSQTADHFKL